VWCVDETLSAESAFLEEEEEAEGEVENESLRRVICRIINIYTVVRCHHLLYGTTIYTSQRLCGRKGHQTAARSSHGLPSVDSIFFDLSENIEFEF
jgi:hypothetical protein